MDSHRRKCPKRYGEVLCSLSTLPTDLHQLAADLGLTIPEIGNAIRRIRGFVCPVATTRGNLGFAAAAWIAEAHWPTAQAKAERYWREVYGE